MDSVNGNAPNFDMNGNSTPGAQDEEPRFGIQEGVPHPGAQDELAVEKLLDNISVSGYDGQDTYYNEEAAPAEFPAMCENKINLSPIFINN